MEFIILLIIAAIAICVFTGKTIYIFLTAAGILILFAALMTLIFLYCTIRLLFSKKKQAKFVRIGKPREKSSFKAAFYLIDGQEYPCLFPEEGILRSKFYPEGRECHVFLNRRMGKVYDRFAVASCILGLVFGISFWIWAAVMYLR